MIWSMQTRPRTGRWRPADPHVGAVAGVTRQPVGVPDGHQAERRRPLGDPGVAVGDARAGVDVLDEGQPATHGHGRDQPQVGGATRRRVEAVGRDAAAHEVEAGRGSQDRGRRVGEVAHLRVEPGRCCQRQGVPEGRLLGVVGGVLRLVAGREVRPDAGEGDATLALEVARRGEQVVPLRPRRTPAGEPGVDLDLHARSEPGAGQRRRARSSSATEYAVTSMSAATAAARSSPGVVSQHSTRPVSPLARTASASSTVATPSHAAPPSRAAREASASPWP